MNRRLLALLLVGACWERPAPERLRLDIESNDVLFSPEIPPGPEGVVADLWVEPRTLRPTIPEVRLATAGGPLHVALHLVARLAHDPSVHGDTPSSITLSLVLDGRAEGTCGVMSLRAGPGSGRVEQQTTLPCVSTVPLPAGPHVVGVRAHLVGDASVDARLGGPWNYVVEETDPRG